jgi:hypothetical protein
MTGRSKATRRIGEAGASAGARRTTSISPLPDPSRVLARPAWQAHLLALAVIVLALGCVLPELVFQGQVLNAPDYEAPAHFATAGRAAMQAGEYPLWNPYLFLGMPSFASLAFTPYVYPVSELLSALGKLPLAPPMLWLLFYYVMAGYGVFLLARSLDCDFWPSVLGGVLFMLTPHLMSMGIFGHGSKLASTAHLPYLAFLGLKLREPGRRLLWAGLLALALGLQLLRGHPQIAFYGLLMLGLLGAVEIVGALRERRPRAEILRFSAGLAGGVVLGFGIAAVLLLPIHAYAPESIRGATEEGGVAYQYATNWSLSVGEIATFFLPSAAGFGEGTYVGTMPFTNFPNYLGQAVLLFGIASLVLLRGRTLVFLLLLGLLALFVSFGNNLSLVYDLFYHHLPYFNKFRVPVMILVLLQLAASLGAALGATALWGRLPRGLVWRKLPDRRDTTRALVACAVLAALLVIVVQPWSAALAQRVAGNTRIPEEARQVYSGVARKMLQGDGVRVGLSLAALAASLFFLWRRKLPADAAGALLVAITVFDLGAVDRRMVQPQHTWPGTASRVGARHETQMQPTGVARWVLQNRLAGAAPPRVLPVGSFFMDNSWMSSGLSSVGGYHPAKLARFEKLVQTSQQTLDRRLLDLFAVNYVLLDERIPNGPEPKYARPDTFLYENPRALPRARVTGRYEVLNSSQDCDTRLLSDAFDRAHVALLETPPEIAPDSSATGTASIRRFTANHVEIDATATAPALLVLAEAWHPDWRATVNGKPARVLPVDCVLRGIEIPAGASKVALQFTCPALRAGLGVTVVSAVVALGLLGGGFWRGRRDTVLLEGKPAAAASAPVREVKA